MKNVVLYGMRGSGKTTIGKALSEKLGRKFIDLDIYISEKIVQDLTFFIKNNGWDEFRNIESTVLNEILKNTNDSIISLGGGTIIFEKNQEIILKNKPILIYIYSDIKNIISRINIDEKEGKIRTSLTGKSHLKELNEVYNSRKNIYEKFFDIKINNESDINYSIKLISKYLNNIDKHEK